MSTENLEKYFIDCPQCGDSVSGLSEGYCDQCNENNYNEIFAHNHQQERWARMSEQERQNEINSAMRS